MYTEATACLVYLNVSVSLSFLDFSISLELWTLYYMSAETYCS